MIWLAPLFFAGIALLAIPFWLHRLKDTRPERLPFASAMLLEASPEPLQVRKHLRFIPLMLLRLLFLLLLALAFAQPVWERTLALLQDTPNTLMLVVDVSASMGAKGQMAAAQAEAGRILDEVDADTEVMLITADQRVSLLSRGDVATARSGLDQLQASQEGLDFGVLARQLAALMSDPTRQYQLHIISDFQRSAFPARFADLVPQPDSGAAYDLSLHPVAVAAAANWQIADAYLDDDALVVSVAGQNNPQQTVDLQWRINEGEWQNQQLEVPADGRARLVVDQLALEPRQNQLDVRLLNDDQLAVDNRYFLVADHTPGQPVLILTSTPDRGAADFLQALFSEQAGSDFEARIMAYSNLDWRVLSRYDWVLIDDLGSLNSNQLASLESYLANGGAVFAAMSEASSGLTEIPLLGGKIDQEAVSSKTAEVSWVDYTHPALNGSDGWEYLRFKRWLPVEPESSTKTLVQLDQGDPLLLEGKVGQGRLLVMTSSLDNAWNNLPVKPLFVRLMLAMGNYLANTQWINSQAFVGDTLSLRDTTELGQLIDPEGNAVMQLGERLQATQLVLDQAGFYQAYHSNGEQWIAVNSPPLESQLQPVETGMLERWSQAALEGEVTEIDSSQRATDDNSMAFWMPLMVLALLILLLESLLSNSWLTRSTGLRQAHRKEVTT